MHWWTQLFSAGSSQHFCQKYSQYTIVALVWWCFKNKNKKIKGLAQVLSESKKEFKLRKELFKRLFSKMIAWIQVWPSRVKFPNQNAPANPIPKSNVPQNPVLANSCTPGSTNNASGKMRGRARGRRFFVRQMCENVPSICTNQVIPVSLQNYSKSFRPNLATIRLSSLGTKFKPI